MLWAGTQPIFLLVITTTILPSSTLAFLVSTTRRRSKEPTTAVSSTTTLCNKNNNKACTPLGCPGGVHRASNSILIDPGSAIRARASLPSSSSTALRRWHRLSAKSDDTAVVVVTAGDPNSPDGGDGVAAAAAANGNDEIEAQLLGGVAEPGVGVVLSIGYNDSTNATTETTTTTARGNVGGRRRKRGADFPSFAYDILKKKATKQRIRRPPANGAVGRTISGSIRNNPSGSVEKKKFVMKYRDTMGKELVFQNIDSNMEEEEDDSRSPWWFLEDIFTGTPFESINPDITNVAQTAKKTRLRTERSYARKESFASENIAVPPSIYDLSTPKCGPLESFWITPPARLLSFSVAYLAFPFMTRFVDALVTMPADKLGEITGTFAPGISILYGTFISLTLSILYNRQRTIQDNVSIECSYLVLLTRNLIRLFGNHRDRAVEAGQCVADQIRTLVRSSRGAELMLLIYADPYAKIRDLIDAHEEDLFDGTASTSASTPTKPGTKTAIKYDGRSGTLIGSCRDVCKDLFRVRASRLSDEALALPPTHFLILNFLTLLILLGYTLSIIPTVDRSGDPSRESSLLFAVLSTIYILFYNFASDLNSPFEGVYQIRRSCAAGHLLQLKWLLANHPLLRGEIDFDEVDEDDDVVRIQSPGLGDFWFEKENLFVETEEINETGLPKKSV
jgi:Protein of unknown function (DUF4239)